MNTRTRNIVIGVIVAVVVLACLAVLVGWVGLRMMGGSGPLLLRHRSGFMPGWGPMFGGGIIAMILFWLLVIAGIAALVWYLASPNRRGVTTAAGPETPLDILKRRYANGEISREEYERMRQELQ